MKSIVILPICCFLAGCSGGGSFNSGPNSFNTQEYQNQGGLDLINASAMYLLGGTGNGVDVAVFDSGGTFNHPDLDQNYSSSRYFIPAYGNADDIDGHGTRVAGIIAAEKNSSGMHGVAFRANIVSYKVLDNSGASSALTDAAWSTAIDTMANTNVLITNNSFGSTTPVTAVTTGSIAASIPQALASYRAYDTLGGVQVWATGNDASSQPNVEAGLPFHFPELQSSWVAVMAVDLNGNEPNYTNRCGVAASWCLAAPGGGDNSSTEGIYSTTNDGGYATASGTSFAAPHVAGAIAALKSVFPNLSFQQIRDRVLVTANKSGAYANAAIFGQGLLDLDRASRPVGGASLAISSSANGSVVSTSGAVIKLSAGALAGYAGTSNILILDNYQRAPFLVPLSAFSQTRRSYLSLSDLDLHAGEFSMEHGTKGLSLALADTGYRVGALSDGSFMAGIGHGTDVLKGFARLSGLPMPHSQYRMHEGATGATLGFSAGSGTVYASVAAGNGEISDETAGTGVSSWAPGSVVTLTYVPENKRRAFGLSIATDLQKPMGWSGSGAFKVSGDSVNLGYSQIIPLNKRANLGFSSQLAYVSADQNPLVHLSNALVAAADLRLSLKLSGNTSFSASVGVEHPVASSDGLIRAASSVNSSGQISYQNVSINQSDLLQFSKASIGLTHQFSENINLSTGWAFVKDGYGTTDAIVGLGARIRF